MPAHASRHLSGSAERLLATIEQSFSPAGEITSLPAIIRSLDTLPARIGLDTLDVIVAAGPVALEHRVKIPGRRVWHHLGATCGSYWQSRPADKSP